MNKRVGGRGRGREGERVNRRVVGRQSLPFLFFDLQLAPLPPPRSPFARPLALSSTQVIKVDPRSEEERA